MNNTFKITFLLPTCEPDEMFRWLYPSLDKLVGAKDFINFAICFQPPYRQEDVNKVINKLTDLGIDYKYFYKDYKVVKPYTPLIRMRNDCSLLYPDSDAYALLDDDMSFESDKIVDILKLVVKSFIEKPKLGVIGLEDFERHYENIFATNNGIIYRGGKYYGFQGIMPHRLDSFGDVKTLVPYEGEDLIDLFGGFQDKFCAMVRLAAGNTAGQIINPYIKHIENRKIRGAQGHGWEEAKFQDGSIAKFIEKYFNPYFTITLSMTLFEKNLMIELYPNYYKSKESNIVELIN